MKIVLSPFAPLPGKFVPLAASSFGDVLTIDGVEFDFAPLPEGATLPADAINSEFFAGPVERINGELHMTLILPHGPDASEAARFPQPITVTTDGAINLPE